MKDLIFHLSIITICVCLSEAYWIQSEHECPITYAPCTPTIMEVDCDDSTDAVTIYTFLTNGNYSEVANILVRRTEKQIKKIQDNYEIYTGKLSMKMENEFPNGHLKNLLLGLLKDITIFISDDLKELHNSGHKNNVEEYLDTIGVFSREALSYVKTVFDGVDSKKGYLSHFKDAELKKFLNYLGRGRRPQLTNRTEVKSNFSSDISWLKSSVTHKGVDPSLLSEIITQNDDLNLRALYKLYEKERNHTYLEHLTTYKVMQKKDPLFHRAVTAMYKITENRVEYFAERLYNSLANNNYRTVNRIIITRREIDLGDIKNTLERIYGNLAEIIKREIKDPKDADYKMILLGLFEKNTN